jgi:hypothetical protein
LLAFLIPLFEAARLMGGSSAQAHIGQREFFSEGKNPEKYRHRLRFFLSAPEL